MIVKPLDTELRALIWSRTAGNGITELFKRELAATDKALRDTHDEVALRQLQGRAKLCEEFLALVEKADQYQDKLEQAKARS